jgi:hypothetical protein
MSPLPEGLPKCSEIMLESINEATRPSEWRKKEAVVNYDWV